MENVLPHYKRPIHFINDPINSVVHWDLATDAFDEKNYKEAVINTINYLNPSILKDKDLKGDINITQMHGSTEVNITITDDSFLVKAPFLKMTNATNKIALQRKVAEVNFHPLTLVQIRQEDNAFMFEYKTDISLCNPYKIYDVLRDVCVYGDDYDDIFIDKYKAAFTRSFAVESGVIAFIILVLVASEKAPPLKIKFNRSTNAAGSFAIANSAVKSK